MQSHLSKNSLNLSISRLARVLSDNLMSSPKHMKKVGWIKVRTEVKLSGFFKVKSFVISYFSWVLGSQMSYVQSFLYHNHDNRVRGRNMSLKKGSKINHDESRTIDLFISQWKIGAICYD